VEGLIGIRQRCRRAVQPDSGVEVAIECVFEAGYDGFWLHRLLAQAGIASRVMDPASLKVDRRARRVKTDRVDAESLLRALQSWRRGDRQACAFVCVPSIDDEDARRPHRELARLRKEGHVNRIKALLALHGVRDYRPLRVDRRVILSQLGTGYGEICLPIVEGRSSVNSRALRWCCSTSTRWGLQWRRPPRLQPSGRSSNQRAMRRQELWRR
jgi:transposase